MVARFAIAAGLHASAPASALNSPLPSLLADRTRPVGQVLLSPPHLTGGEMAALEVTLESG